MFNLHWITYGIYRVETMMIIKYILRIFLYFHLKNFSPEMQLVAMVPKHNISIPSFRCQQIKFRHLNANNNLQKTKWKSFDSSVRRSFRRRMKWKKIFNEKLFDKIQYLLCISTTLSRFKTTTKKLFSFLCKNDFYFCVLTLLWNHNGKING